MAVCSNQYGTLWDTPRPGRCRSAVGCQPTTANTPAGPGHSFQIVFPTVGELDAGTDNQVLDRCGDQDLAGTRRRTYPRSDVNGQSSDNPLVALAELPVASNSRSPSKVSTLTFTSLR